MIKSVKTATADQALPSGLSFYIDPTARATNQDVMNATVILNLEGVPLATSLSLLLEQLGLSYRVQKDGIVIIGAKPKDPSPGAEGLTDRAARTWLRLQQVADIPFEKETPLDDVVRFVRETTRTKEPGDTGLPIYADSIGLQEHERSMSSTVMLKLEGFPLATSLELLLSPLDLIYSVRRDGLLVITSRDRAGDDRLVGEA